MLGIILCSYVVNFALLRLDTQWHRIIGLGAVPGLALAIGMLSMCYSPAVW